MEDFHIIRIIIFSIITFLVAMILTPAYIKLLIKFNLGKNIRSEASLGGGKAKQFHKLHAHKQGTPTMGGGMVLGTIAIMVILSVILVLLSDIIGLDLRNSLWNRNETYLILFTGATIGLLGAIDDYLNIRGIGKTKGMSARVKIIGLSTFALAGGLWFSYKLGYNSITLPFTGEMTIGIWYIPLFIFILISMANAVNITDGLDGLVMGLLAQNFALYTLITYDKELFLLSTICAITLASILGFLWFNIKPAKFYLGDIGSLPLGAMLGVMAMMTDTLIVLFIVSGVYVWEILSVIIQLTSKKLRNGKKVFKIAPYHHHLEAIGMKEETIVMRLWLVGAILTGVGLIAYVLIR